MYKPATIKDIALALGLSPSTVSRALRDSYEISTKTKTLVIEYANQVNYRSNPIALSLRNKRSYSIGIVVPEVANSFFSQVIAGIESIAYDKGYHTIITQTYDTSERELINVNHLANRSVDGLLISMSSATSDYEFIKKLHDEGLPVVFFDSIVDEIETFKVTSDNFSGAYNATEALIKAGRKKIAFLANAAKLSTTNKRVEGYMKALQDNGLAFSTELLQPCSLGGHDYQEIEEIIKNLLAMPEKPDALFVSSDRISIKCIRALKKLRVDPTTISVAGFSNSDVVDLLVPQIAYVRQKAFDMGQIAVEMLLKLIESKYPITEFETRVLDTELYGVGGERLI